MTIIFSCLHLTAVFIGLGLAVFSPWVDISSQGLKLGGITLSAALLGMLLFLPLISIGTQFSYWYALLESQSSKIKQGLWFVGVVTLISLTSFWYGYLLNTEFRAFEYRTLFSSVLFLYSVLTITVLVCKHRNICELVSISRRQFTRLGRKSVLGAILLVVIGSATFSYLFLGGMPHVSDAHRYLMQGRALWSGYLTLELIYPELWSTEIFKAADGTYRLGPYPLGWPAILGFFDRLNVAWLANPLLSGALVWATYKLLSNRVDVSIAAITALVLGFSPWLYWNAGTQLSHVASALWLLLFLTGFQKTLDTRSTVFGLLSGLALGAAVVTRAQDAAFFTLPCISISVWMLLRRPTSWIAPLAAVLAGVIPGLVVYFWTNIYLMGDIMTTTYGDNAVTTVSHAMPRNPLTYVVWLHESWVGLSTQWFAGAIPGALVTSVGIWFGRSYLKQAKLFVACSVSLFICYGLFVFAGRTWFGPRWYAPLIPFLGFLMAAGIAGAIRTYRRRGSGGRLARVYLVMTMVGLLVTWLIAVPFHALELVRHPPHGTDRRIVDAVDDAGLSNAVVALNKDYFIPGSSEPSYKFLRSGFWEMKIPFENSNIIYVISIPGWAEKAKTLWPHRDLYQISLSPSAFELDAINGDAERSFP